MSDMSNPFQSPEAETKIETPLVSQGVLTNTMLKFLSDASPWLRFMGIMGFIGSGFLALIGLLCLILMPFAGGVFDGFLPGFPISFAVMAMYGIYLIGAGVLMFFSALFTYRFGAKIRSYVQTNSEAELEQAFKNNRSLWKFYGILTIIGLASIPVMIIIGIIAAVAVMAYV
jgi:hypothetical protein